MEIVHCFFKWARASYSNCGPWTGSLVVTRDGQIRTCISMRRPMVPKLFRVGKGQLCQTITQGRWPFPGPSPFSR